MITWTCPTHGTDMIPTRDTTEYWDADAQQWCLNDDSEHPYCPECGRMLESTTTEAP